MKMLLEFDGDIALTFDQELALYKHKHGFITKPQFAFHLMSSALKRKASRRKSNAKKNALVNNLRK